MTNLRILFVDDEPAVLAGLSRALFHLADEWEVDTAESGAEALELLASEPFDVVVTDMQMPGMDGAELLHRVHAQFPDTVRIVLSGHTKLQDALKAAPVAHQFLAKPCSSEDLEEVIERACELRALTGSETIRAAIGNLAALPPVPRLYRRLSCMLEDPNAAIEDVAELIESDPAIAAKTLQIANSPLFCVGHKMARLRDAVSRLGIAMVRNIAMVSELFRPAGETAVPPARLESEAELAARVGLVASSLFGRTSGLRDAAFMAGLLHGVGRLALWTIKPDWERQVAEHVANCGGSTDEAEHALFGADQAGVGGYLLGLWGLPQAIVEAVAFHRRPARTQLCGLDLVAAVHLGCAVATGGTPDEAYLGLLGDSEEEQKSWVEDARVSIGLHEVTS